jgi:hypothetical protein
VTRHDCRGRCPTASDEAIEVFRTGVKDVLEIIYDGLFEKSTSLVKLLEWAALPTG